MQQHSHLTTAPASATPRMLAAVAALAGLAAILFLLHPPVARSAEANAAVVSTATTNLGRILVDSRGRTLYLFEKDRNGKSACSGQCATFWPPLVTKGRPHAAGGTKASLIGTIRRTDGRLQVTYKHHPLYRFVKDTRKGQTNGEGVNAFGFLHAGQRDQHHRQDRRQHLRPELRALLREVQHEELTRHRDATSRSEARR